MNLGLAGAAVLVTGGSRGLGRALATGFALEGARVAVCARNPQALESTAAEIRRTGAECIGIPADLFSADDCRRVVDRTVAAFGGVDVLVNNASTNVDRVPSSLENASDEQVLERFMGKTLAAIRCTRSVIPAMRSRRGGRIVCIGGTSARTVFRGDDLPTSGTQIPQALGNAGLASFVKYVSEEVAGDGIVVNVVHPHLTRTDRHAARMAARAAELRVAPEDVEADLARRMPIGRLVEMSDIVPIVLLLASPLASAITGQAIAVDGGAVRSVNY